MPEYLASFPGQENRKGAPLVLVHSARPITQPGRPLTQFELTGFAEFFAAHMGYDARQAADHMVTWYQVQIGADICDMTDAAVLRLQVMSLCRDKQLQVRPRPSDDQALIGPPEIITYPLLGDAAGPSLFAWLKGRITSGIDWAYEGERPSPEKMVKTALVGIGFAIGIYLLTVGAMCL